MAPLPDLVPAATEEKVADIARLPRRARDMTVGDLPHAGVVVSLRTAETESAERRQACRRQHPAGGARNAPVDAA